MNIETYIVGKTKIAEVVSDKILIKSANDGLDLLANLNHQNFEKMIIYEDNITPDFFVFKNGLACEVLQEFSNYRFQLAIIGDFTKHTCRNLNDFMNESNKVGRINFVSSIAEALDKLS